MLVLQIVALSIVVVVPLIVAVISKSPVSFDCKTAAKMIAKMFSSSYLLKKDFESNFEFFQLLVLIVFLTKLIRSQVHVVRLVLRVDVAMVVQIESAPQFQLFHLWKLSLIRLVF